jgi:Spy/CpxP family protein refolding chaperone
MTKIRLLIVACVLVVFAAGVALGLAMSRPHRPGRGGSALAGQLGLTAAQQTEMHNIWAEVMSKARQEEGQQREALRKERDDAIRALLPDAQVVRYEEILKTYASKTAALNMALEEGRRKTFDEAVARTKTILTEKQRVKYEEILKQREAGEGGRGGPGERGDRGRDGERGEHGHPETSEEAHVPLPPPPPPAQ